MQPFPVLWTAARHTGIESDDARGDAHLTARTDTIRRQRFFDAQLVALMLEHDLRLLYTENAGIEGRNPFGD
jgi:hypothetical protein